MTGSLHAWSQPSQAVRREGFRQVPRLKSHAAGIAVALQALTASRSEFRLFRQSWQTGHAALQQSLRQMTRPASTNSLQCLAAGTWPTQGLWSLLRFGKQRSGSTGDGKEGVPSAASVDSPIDATRTLPVLSPLPDESGPVLEIETGAASIPNFQKANKLGEDAYFISRDGKCFGVADGVGGWALSGVDSGEYSRLLMQMAQFFAESHKLDAHPKQLLWAAYKQTQVRGSSTACILKLKHDILHACNVGDSGFLIIRNEDVIFQSPHQQHSFNFPYQLGKQEVDAANESPARAQTFAVQLQPDDIIITGTDGLFDNVFAEESAALVRHSRSKGEPASAAAKTLADYTFKKASDVRHMSPFAYAAQAHGHRFVGGKLDDITVLVSYISAAKAESEAPSDQAPPLLSKL